MQGVLFSEGPDRFSILAGDSSLAWQQVDDSTITVTLPSMASDAISLVYDSKAGRINLGVIDVVGFHDVKIADNDIFSHIDPWPDPAGQQVLGVINGTPFNWNPAILDPATGHVTVHSNLAMVVPMYPGLSYQSGVTFLAPAPNLSEVWRLEPTPTLLDSIPFRSYRTFQLNDSLFVTAGNNNDVYSFLIAISDSGTIASATLLSTRAANHMRFSPGGDRAAAGVGTSAGLRDPAIPVFDLATGDVAYGISVIYTLGASAFSGDGSLLYMTGATAQGRTDSSLVIAADAGNGGIVRSVSIPDRAVGLGLDEASGRLLIPVLDANCGLHLVVLEASTLAVEADLQVPPGDSPCDSEYDYATLIARPNSPTAFVVKATGQLPARAFRFDLRD